MTDKAIDNITESLDAIAKSYGERVKTMGSTAKAAGWRDTQTQHLRFQQLFHLFGDGDEAFSLIDLGCGYGEMLKAVPEQLDERLYRYVGYDISMEMVEEGRQLFADDERISFVCESEIEDSADYIVASGIFNHHFGTDPAVWQEHIMNTVAQMVDKAAKGAAFNIMTTHVDFQEDYIYYADPAYMLDQCLERFGRHVRLLHDYPLYEFTVLIDKKD
ncbi:MAG: class I SAM-dependent methyltransferase [Rhodospirillales bacterium]|nr:class I SAM-dependent methyltransferase [Rhodospirillales bacterium]MCB9995381.1 class I SAM-dependent methyltransferase [Rhodospirillales bacterium]